MNTNAFTPLIAANPDIVTLREGYLLEFTEGYGCGGIEEEYHVFLPQETYHDKRGISAMEVLAEEVNDAIKAKKTAAEAQKVADAGPKPEWTPEWEGTRADYEQAAKEYRDRATLTFNRKQAIVETWAEHDGTVLTVDYPVRAINTYEKEEPDLRTVYSMAFHTEHGCRCMGGSRYGLLDSSDEKEFLAGTAEYKEENFLAPAVTLVTVNNQWVFITKGYIDDATARTLLSELAELWKERIIKNSEDIADTQKQIDALVTKEELAAMAPGEWEQHKDEPQKRTGLEWRLRSALTSKDTPLDGVQSPLRMTLPELEPKDAYGWLSRYTTHGRAWEGIGEESGD